MDKDGIIDDSMVVNKEYFEPLKDQLTCQICLGLLNNPVMCTSCETPFCLKCITQWKSKKNTCPSRCPQIKIKEVPRLFKNMLDGLKLKCKNGCVVSLLDYSNHVSHCDGNSKKEIKCWNCSSVVKKLVMTEEQYKSFKKDIEKRDRGSYELIAQLKLEIQKRDEEIASMKNIANQNIVKSNQNQRNNVGGGVVEQNLQILQVNQPVVVSQLLSEDHRSKTTIPNSNSTNNTGSQVRKRSVKTLVHLPSKTDSINLQEVANIICPCEVLALASYKIDNKVFIASGGIDGKMRIYNRETSLLVETLSSHTKQINCITTLILNNNTYIASGSSDASLKIVNTTNFKYEINLVGHTGSVNSLTSLLMKNQTTILISGSSDNTIKIWNPSSQSQLLMLSIKDSPMLSVTSFVVNNKNFIVGGNEEKTIKIWNYENIKDQIDFIQSLSVGNHETVYCLNTYITANEQVVIISGGEDKSIKIWNPAGGKLIMTLTGHENAITCLESFLQFDIRYIVSGSLDMTIKLWNPALKSLVYDIKQHTGKITSLTINPSAGEIISASYDKTIKIFR